MLEGKCDPCVFSCRLAKYLMNIWTDFNQIHPKQPLGVFFFTTD